MTLNVVGVYADLLHFLESFKLVCDHYISTFMPTKPLPRGKKSKYHKECLKYANAKYHGPIVQSIYEKYIRSRERDVNGIINKYKNPNNMVT